MPLAYLVPGTWAVQGDIKSQPVQQGIRLGFLCMLLPEARGDPEANQITMTAGPVAHCTSHGSEQLSEEEQRGTPGERGHKAQVPCSTLGSLKGETTEAQMGTSTQPHVCTYSYVCVHTYMHIILVGHLLGGSPKGPPPSD